MSFLKLGRGRGLDFFAMDRGVGELSTYVTGYWKVVRVVVWFLLGDMAGWER